MNKNILSKESVVVSILDIKLLDLSLKEGYGFEHSTYQTPYLRNWAVCTKDLGLVLVLS